VTDRSAAGPGTGKKRRKLRRNDAVGTLERIDQQVQLVRAELAGLHRNLVDAQRNSTMSRDTLLQKANEQLVVAALHAETIAAQAVSHFAELARRSQHDVLTETPNRVLMLERLENAIIPGAKK
jgi:diguanylate cyclase